MSALKCTMLFNYVSNTGDQSGVSTVDNAITRTGGWSESWYLQGVAQSEATTRFLNLCRLRAAMLPIACAVAGQRYQTVDPVGPSQTGSTVFPGTAGTLADIPQMALYFRMYSDSGRNIRPFFMRGLPDARSVRGEYMPSQAFDTAIDNFFANIRGSLFRFRGRDLSLPEIPLISVAVNGTVQTANPHTYTVGTMVRILRTVDADGRKLGGLFQVATVINSFSFTIIPNPAWVTDGGKVRQEAIIFTGVNQVSQPRVAVKKVGKAFFGYRGRQSKRR